MANKTPYEIRLELIQEARLILQAQSSKPEFMPSTEDVVAEAESGLVLLLLLVGLEDHLVSSVGG